MLISRVLKWSSLGLFVLVAAGFAYAYTRGQYVGDALEGDRPLVLFGARLYDPVDHELTDGAVIVIEDSLIISVGDEHTPLPENSRILDVRGFTLLPGFIDSHVFLSGIAIDPSTGQRELALFPYAWMFARKFPDRRRGLIEAGVTTVKSVGDPLQWIANLANRTRLMELAGPRIFYSGPVMTAPGGHPVARLRSAGQGDTSYIAQVARQLADTAAARVAVNRVARNADFIAAIIDSRNPDGAPGLDEDVLRTIVETADRNELATIAEVRAPHDVALALRHGVRGLEGMPGAPLDSAMLQRMGLAGTFVDPMLHAQLVWGLDHTSKTALADNLDRALAAGVRIVAGSGSPEGRRAFGDALHAELRAMVEFGMTPAAAISAVSSEAAAYLGVEERLGSLAAGKLADVVAVAGNPLIDISDAARIHLVIANGRVLVNRLDELERPHRFIASAGGDGRLR